MPKPEQDALDGALIAAARDGDVRLLGELLDRGANIERVSDGGSNALHWAASRGRAEAVRALLARGAAVDVSNADGETALLAAAYIGSVESVRALLDHGAAMDHHNKMDDSALILAAGFPIEKGEYGTPCERHQGHDAVVRELLDRGASLDDRNIEERSAIEEAGAKGNVAAVRMLFDKGAELGEDFEGDLLRWAACRGFADTAKGLLDAGMAIDNRDGDGWTPLMWAISYRRTSLVNMLVDRGGAVDGDAGVQLEGFLAWLESAAESAVERMYEAHDKGAASASYATAKDHLHDAIALAQRLKQEERAERLGARLDHIKAVFRGQF